MTWIKLRKYLKKDVEIDRIDDLKKWQVNKLNTSVLLFYLSCEKKISEIDILIDKLINSEPLCIIISGNMEDSIFDLLLKKLSIKKTSHHIMTGISKEKKIDDIFNLFFSSCWPAEETFNSWKKYSILFAGEDSDFVNFRKRLANFLR